MVYAGGGRTIMFYTIVLTYEYMSDCSYKIYNIWLYAIKLWYLAGFVVLIIFLNLIAVYGYVYL